MYTSVISAVPRHSFLEVWVNSFSKILFLALTVCGSILNKMDEMAQWSVCVGGGGLIVDQIFLGALILTAACEALGNCAPSCIPYTQNDWLAMVMKCIAQRAAHRQKMTRLDPYCPKALVSSIQTSTPAPSQTQDLKKAHPHDARIRLARVSMHPDPLALTQPTTKGGLRMVF